MVAGMFSTAMSLFNYTIAPNNMKQDEVVSAASLSALIGMYPVSIYVIYRLNLREL